MSNGMDITKGLLIGALAGLSIGLLAGNDRNRNKIMCAAKKTVSAVEDTVKDAVDFRN